MAKYADVVAKLLLAELEDERDVQETRRASRGRAKHARKERIDVRRAGFRLVREAAQHEEECAAQLKLNCRAARLANRAAARADKEARDAATRAAQEAAKGAAKAAKRAAAQETTDRAAAFDKGLRQALANLTDDESETEHAAGFSLDREIFTCPISLELMEEPVIAMDGHTYERASIESWLRLHDYSPMTQEPLPSKLLLRNNIMLRLLPFIRSEA
jgi:hypothetical protein